MALLHGKIICLVASLAPLTCIHHESITPVFVFGDLIYRLPDIAALISQRGNLSDVGWR